MFLHVWALCQQFLQLCRHRSLQFPELYPDRGIAEAQVRSAAAHQVILVLVPVDLDAVSASGTLQQAGEPGMFTPACTPQLPVIVQFILTLEP